MNLHQHPIFSSIAKTGAIWAFFCVLFNLWHSKNIGADAAAFAVKAGWTLWVCFLATMGLFALGKFLAGIFVLVASPQKSPTLIIRTSYWGTIKLASFLLLNAVLVKHSGIPTLAILLGMGTLCVVPLSAGIWWNRAYRDFQHAW